MGYTVGEVARWSGVTVRALHHYEHIALLSPAARSASGYRVYDDADLERLQQILFYRELGFSLDHISVVLASPRDAVEHLAYQRELLLDRIQGLEGLVAAIDQAMEAKTMGTTPTPAERFAALIEGKTKIIIDAGDGTVLIRSKDDITAGDGAKHDVIEGKAASSTTTAAVERAWERLGGTYFDFKIECGFDHETGALLVADVIDSDSGRLRFGDRDMSKQAYRDGSQSLPEIRKTFDKVADLTQQFV